MKHFNFKERWIETVIFLFGAVMVFVGFAVPFPAFVSNALQSIGSSLIGSAVVGFIYNLYNEQENVLKSWGVDKVYRTRTEKSNDSDPKLRKAKERLDIVAFGMKSFRSNHRKEMCECLTNGVNVRILTMNPDCDFVRQRAKEENEHEEQIRHGIKDLVKWCEEINTEVKKTSKKSGQIEIRFYNCMTLEFYWRCDDELYFGPYLLEKDSQQTITFRAKRGGKLFDIYTEYFEELWANETFISSQKL